MDALAFVAGGMKNYKTIRSRTTALRDGKLVITATKGGTSNFETSRVITKNKKTFRYGRIDIRAKLPKGQGFWPALWMLEENIDEVGWPAFGEIDIMEHVGHKVNETSAAIHWGDRDQGFSNFKTHEFKHGRSFHDEFHPYTIIW